MSYQADLMDLQIGSTSPTDEPISRGLKRLSLLGRPLGEGADRLGSIDLNRSSTRDAQSPPLGAPFSPCSPVNAGSRIRRMDTKSSISYAPSPGRDAGAGARGTDGRVGMNRGVTLTEKHADLLTLIAQQERRVSELKQELATQEELLIDYKSQWTSTISQSHPTQPTFNRRRSRIEHQRSPTIDSTSTTTSHTLSTLSESIESPSPRDIASLFPDSTLTDAQLRLTNALDDIAGSSIMTTLMNGLNSAEGVVSPAAIEGGKRFWGQLIKTVGAAAGGNVPESTEMDVGERIPAPPVNIRRLTGERGEGESMGKGATGSGVDRRGASMPHESKEDGWGWS